MRIENLSSAVAKDLIDLINSMKGFEKTGGASFKTSKGNKSYNWIPLDNILEKVKENDNFALMQPLGTDNEGRPSIKTILIHKSGAVLESDYYPIGYTEGDNPQNKGIATTYMKRYSLASFLGLSSETDNDGDIDFETPEELAEAKRKKDFAKAQKELTKVFESLVVTFGDKEAIYQSLGTDRETFLIDLQTNPVDLLAQVKRLQGDGHVK